MAGAGVTTATLAPLIALGVTEVHGSCSADTPGDPRAAAFGFGPAAGRQTDAARVRDMKAAMEALGGSHRHV
jgi:copper homeostasis protein